MAGEGRTVYIVMAQSVIPTQMAHKMLGCYCVCDSCDTARAVLRRDTREGEIIPGGYITSHVIQTHEDIDMCF